MTDTQVTVSGADELAKQVGLPITKTQEIMLGFSEHAKKLTEYEEDYKKILVQKKKGITPELCAEAKALRLKLVKVRTGSDATHKTMKSDVLLVSRAIDGAKNIFQLQVKERENPLMDIEQHYEKIEKERLEKIGAERREKLEAFGWEDNGTMDLVGMPEELFEGFLNGLKAKKKEDEANAAEALAAEKAKEAAEKLGAERVALIDKEALRYFITEENMSGLNTMLEDDFQAVLTEARAGVQKKKDEDAAAEKEREALEKKAAEAEAATKEAEKLAAAEAEKVIAAAAERRRAEAKKLGIEDYIALSLNNGNVIGEMADSDWNKERDEAVKQKTDKDNMEAEKTKKNKKYRDWLAKNNVTPAQLEAGEYAIDIEAKLGKTHFTLSKVISTTII